MLFRVSSVTDSRRASLIIQGDAMDELIEAARAHTKDLRKGAADVEAAERWERLAGAARTVDAPIAVAPEVPHPIH
jgi:hypothetical protein